MNDSLFIYSPHCTAFEILVHNQGVKPVAPAVEAWGLNYWTTRAVPIMGILGFTPVILFNHVSSLIFPLVLYGILNFFKFQSFFKAPWFIIITILLIVVNAYYISYHLNHSGFTFTPNLVVHFQWGSIDQQLFFFFCPCLKNVSIWQSYKFWIW